ncbi:tannase/feruloyl esterase family alpha/beta hydrolase [Microbacterium sp. P04]|uniref:tannase/feruloyl esterase family alpha/beta hydrolase n=1 Tax=Microbacterium sp. P04 TaxID=3366947 RepID=UPI0037474B35
MKKTRPMMIAAVIAAALVAVPTPSFGAAAPFPPEEQPAAVAAITDAQCSARTGSEITASDDDAEGAASAVTATIVTATIITTASGDLACSLSGVIEGRVGYTVQLPLTDWNGRYFQTGCGGFCGYTPIASCADALTAGFAVGAEDSGHVDPRGGAEWALDNPEAEADWGYRSPHLLAVVADALIVEVYGQAAETTYFQGCSTGGRQALSEAQRYPDDFDGIVAGAPALYQNYLAVLSQGGFEKANRRADGTAILTTTAIATLSAAVQQACGGVGGVISDPIGCDFSPATLQCADGAVGVDCLTAEQVQTVQRLYSAPVAEDGTVLYPGGVPLGSEALWRGSTVGSDASLSGSGSYAQNVLRYLAFPDDPGSTYALSDFDPSTQYRQLDAQAEIYNAQDPDLSAFAEGGGKLILYHGLADPLITPYGTIDYFESVVERDGGAAVTDEYARLFLLPGVGHCTGGPGESTVDWLASIVDWVEDDVAPASVTAERQAAGQVVSSRVIDPFVSGSADERISVWFAGARAAAPVDPPVDPEDPPVDPEPTDPDGGGGEPQPSPSGSPDPTAGLPTAGSDADGGSDAATRGALAGTGSEVAWPLIGGGALALTVGAAALILATRARRRTT